MTNDDVLKFAGRVEQFVHRELDGNIRNVTPYILGHMMGQLLLEAINDGVPNAVELSHIEAELSDGVNDGLSDYAQSCGIDIPPAEHPNRANLN